MKTRLSQTTGVAEPLPGIRTFHFTFFVSVHSTGGFARGATPLASGPRHWGQYCSAEDEAACEAAAASAMMTTTAARARTRTEQGWEFISYCAVQDRNDAEGQGCKFRRRLDGAQWIRAWNR